MPTEEEMEKAFEGNYQQIHWCSFINCHTQVTCVGVQDTDLF